MKPSIELELFRDALYTCSAASCGFCREDCPIFTGVRKESTYARGVSAIMLALLDGFIKPNERLAETISLCTTCRWCARALNIKRTYNPWGLPSSKRMAWTKGFTVETLSDKTCNEVFFVCCAYSYDARAREVVNVAATLFEKIGVPFVTLGNDQWCCGDMALRLGERGLFELLAEHNVQMFEKYKIRNLISLSPHCYNTLKNEYHASNINNMHYTQVIAEKVDQGKLKPSKRIEKKVAFHDPCYLGRYNNMYEQPRKMLEAIPGVKLVEMYRNKRHSFCCGGGSGRVLTEDLPYLERPSMERLKEAVEVGADVIATACPLCLIMLTDATKSFGLEEKINVKDIIELVVEAL